MFSLKFQELMPNGVALEFDAFYKRLNRLWLTEHNEDGTHITPPAAEISDLGLPVGTVIPYAGSSVPTGWLLCDGTAVSRATYAALFTVVGTSYGVGDGATTFNLPDLRQRFPLGKAASGTGSTLGATGGAIDHSHTGPSHNHTITAGGTGATGAPSATTTVQSGVGATVASDTHTHTGPSHDHGGTTGSAGAGSTGTANPPFLALNFLILYS